MRPGRGYGAQLEDTERALRALDEGRMTITGTDPAAARQRLLDKVIELKARKRAQDARRNAIRRARVR